MESRRVEVGLRSEPLEETREEPRPRTTEPSTPFRILVLGDFSGGDVRERDPDRPLGGRRTVPFDRDDVDRALRAHAPSVRIPLPGSERAEEVVSFESLDDFHPDRLYARLEVIRDLRELRAELASPTGSDPGTSGGLLDRVLNETAGTGGEGVPRSADRAADGSGATSDGGEPERTRADGPPRTSEELDEVVRRIVGPHLVPGPDPEREARLERVDRAISATMRSVLHHPDFQALEAAWRSVDFLARRIETGRSLKLALLDVSREELRRDLASAGEQGGAGAIDETELHRIVVRESGEAVGAEPWSLLVGLHRFGSGDAEVLARLGELARTARAPFVAEATLELAGMDVDDGTLAVRRVGDEAAAGERGRHAWEELRESPVAPWLGLGVPRLLLRVPYGEDTRPCESFPFEEVNEKAGEGALAHDDYLWGSPACACAVLLARTFATDGWQSRPGRHRDLERLPLHTYRRNGASRLKPCAEFKMTERVASELLERGFMPLAWIKGRPSARLVRFQSIARPSARLAGRWERG